MSLGNEQLDRLLGGGIVKHKSTILVGEPGCGKSDLALQFLLNPEYDSLPAAYICIDKKPERVLEKAKRNYSNVDERIQNNTLRFVEISTQDWNSSQEVNDLLLNIQLQIDALFQNFELDRIVVDSILPQVLLNHPLEKKYYFIREFYNIIHLFNTTSLSIMYDDSISSLLWLDTNIISDQLIFKREIENNYPIYTLDISKNNEHNIFGKYRFRLNSQNNIQLVHKL